jgi:hypothetical protein
MRNAGIKDYSGFAREVLSIVKDKSISFEVFSDDLNEMETQAKRIATWGENVYVKIPITNTKGVSTQNLIRTLVQDKIKVNVTAIMTLEQVKLTAVSLNPEVPSYVSIFAGRIADTGRDPIRIIDDQSLSMGIHSAGNKREKNVKSEYESTSYHAPKERQMNRFGDTGGASRFFYCAKASKSERNKGLEGFDEKENKHSTYGIHSDEGLIHNGRNPENRSRAMSNFHPTVKPVKLMQYLVRLITPPNGKVLDPFCGSGTTGIACKLEGFEFIGLEQDAEYSKIAQSRIDNYEEEIEQIVYITNKEGEKVQITQTSLF